MCVAQVGICNKRITKIGIYHKSNHAGLRLAATEHSHSKWFGLFQFSKVTIQNAEFYNDCILGVTNCVKRYSTPDEIKAPHEERYFTLMMVIVPIFKAIKVTDSVFSLRLNPLFCTCFPSKPFHDLLIRAEYVWFCFSPLFRTKHKSFLARTHKKHL